MAPLVTGTIALLGQSLGTCTIRRLIGRGDMGAVYLAQQDCPQRVVAVKVLLPEFLADQASRLDFLARFRREADAMAGLDHGNIIPIYAYGEQEQVAYLVMPYLTGGSLERKLEKWNVLALSEALFLVEQVAAALDYAHARGILHRDLKPANLLFDADGRVLLTDFGLTRIAGGARDQQGVSVLADAGTISGTPEYFSPEQVVGQALDQRSDIYALGIMLYQMLTGQVPFSGATPVATAMQHVEASPPPLSQLNPIISPAIEAVVLKALAKQPQQRYDSAGQLAQAFSAALTSTGIDLARPPWVAYGKASELFTPMPLTHEEMLPSSAHEPVTVVDRSAGIDKPTSFAHGHQLRSSAAHAPAIAKKRAHRRSRQAAVLCILSVLLLLIGGSLTYLYTAQIGPRAARGPQTQSARVSQPHSSLITVTPTFTAAPTANPDLPAPAIPVGKLLFGTPLPGFLCDAFSGSWSETATARITCMAAATELATTNPHQLAATFLEALPGGQGVPNDYILQVQLRQGPHSRGAFGVLFRNQAGAVLGAYGFLLSSNSNWSSYVYDNVTKKAMQLYTHRTTTPLQGVITLDIHVQKDTFLFYIDGHEQGYIVSPLYASGTVGLAVDTAADVFFSNFALYALPNK